MNRIDEKMGSAGCWCPVFFSPPDKPGGCSLRAGTRCQRAPRFLNLIKIKIYMNRIDEKMGAAGYS